MVVYSNVAHDRTGRNKANLAFVFDFVKEPEALDFVSCLIVLAAPTLKNINLMNLAIMATYLLLVVETSQPSGSHIACDAKGIIMVGLIDVIRITQVLC